MVTASETRTGAEEAGCLARTTRKHSVTETWKCFLCWSHGRMNVPKHQTVHIKIRTFYGNYILIKLTLKTSAWPLSAPQPTLYILLSLLL